MFDILMPRITNHASLGFCNLYRVQHCSFLDLEEKLANDPFLKGQKKKKNERNTKKRQGDPSHLLLDVITWDQALNNCLK